MDITILAGWGEFLGGIAVILSLVYLASHVRQNSNLQRATTTIATAQIQNSYTPLLVQDAEVSRIYWAGLTDYASLSEQDRGRFDPLMTMLFQGFSYRHQFYEEGIASPQAWEQNVHGMRWVLGNTGALQWWREWREVSGLISWAFRPTQRPIPMRSGSLSGSNPLTKTSPSSWAAPTHLSCRPRF